MNIITKKVRLIPAPFVGTRIKIVLDDPDSLSWGMSGLLLAEGHEKAVIDWGDGSTTEFTGSGLLIHDYAQAGEYELRITDDISSITCSHLSILSPFCTPYASMIREFTTNAVHLDTIGICAFNKASNLRSFHCEGSGLRSLSAYAFWTCSSLSGRIDLPHVNNVTNNAFVFCPGITELHFSEADAETITTLPGYDISFGAENASVSCDL